MPEFLTGLIIYCEVFYFTMTSIFFSFFLINPTAVSVCLDHASTKEGTWRMALEKLFSMLSNFNCFLLICFVADFLYWTYDRSQSSNDACSNKCLQWTISTGGGKTGDRTGKTFTRCFFSRFCTPIFLKLHILFLFS